MQVIGITFAMASQGRTNLFRSTINYSVVFEKCLIHLTNEKGIRTVILLRLINVF